MKISKKQLIFVAVLTFMVIVAVAGWHYWARTHVSAFPTNSRDTVSSWTFKGAYTGNDTLVAQANADMAHLTDLLGKGQYDDYDLYIGLGNDEGLLGNGAKALMDYDRAIKIHPDKGLAYANIGHLFDQVGALYTAADAYAKAVTAEPSQLEYHIERIAFLTTKLPKENALIIAALTDASKQFGDIAQVLSLEAQWFEGQGQYEKAIEAWQRAKLISPGRDTSAMDAQIARDRAKISK